MRKINRRKIEQSLITCIHGRDPGKLSNLPKWLKPHLKYYLQLKTKEDVGGSGLRIQRGGRQFTWRWKSKYWVNKCLLGPAETVGYRVGSDPPHLAHIICRYLWW